MGTESGLEHTGYLIDTTSRQYPASSSWEPPFKEPSYGCTPNRDDVVPDFFYLSRAIPSSRSSSASANRVLTKSSVVRFSRFASVRVSGRTVLWPVQLFDDGEVARHERQHFVDPLGCFIAIDIEEGTKEPLGKICRAEWGDFLAILGILC